MVEKILSEENVLWNKWIAVPPYQKGLLSASVIVNGTVLGTLKKTFYKDEEFTIDYELEDKKILTYRFIMANAQDGLWINPFIQHLENNETEPRVTRIRLKNSNNKCLNDAIKLVWKTKSILTVNKQLGTMDQAYSLFNKSVQPSDQVMLKSTNDFEHNVKNWTSGPTDSNRAFSGRSSGYIPQGGYSASFSTPLDSLWKNTKSNELSIETDARCLLAEKSGAILVVVIEKSEDDSWDGCDIKNEMHLNEWSYGSVYKLLKKEKHNSGFLTIYVWNPGVNAMNVDDIRVVIKPVLIKQ